MEGRDGVRGVQGREHQVAGQGGLYGDPGSLDISDLPDENDVGVLSQDGAEACREGESGLLVRLDLIDAGEDYSTGPRSS